MVIREKGHGIEWEGTCNLKISTKFNDYLGISNTVENKAIQMHFLNGLGKSIIEILTFGINELNNNFFVIYI